MTAAERAASHDRMANHHGALAQAFRQSAKKHTPTPSGPVSFDPVRDAQLHLQQAGPRVFLPSDSSSTKKQWKVERAVARAKRTEQQIRAVVRDELARATDHRTEEQKRHGFAVGVSAAEGLINRALGYGTAAAESLDVERPTREGDDLTFQGADDLQQSGSQPDGRSEVVQSAIVDGLSDTSAECGSRSGLGRNFEVPQSDGHSSSPSFIVDTPSVGDGLVPGVATPGSGHPVVRVTAELVDYLAGKLSPGFAAAYCPTTVDRRVVVAQVLDAMAGER